jgi:hypothetical protein
MQSSEVFDVNEVVVPTLSILHGLNFKEEMLSREMDGKIIAVRKSV